MWWVYYLRDPRDGKIRYVGCTCHPISRLQDHLKGRESTTKKWVLGLFRIGLFPSFVPMKLFHSKEKATRAETFHIKDLTKQGVRLLNKKSTGRQLPRRKRCKACGQMGDS